MDNAQEFRSHAFKDYCIANGITLTYSVSYEHAQNGLAKAFLKKIQLVARPLLLHAKLPSNLWGYAVVHAAFLLRLRPTLLNTQTPYELLSGRHLMYRTFASLDVKCGYLYSIQKDTPLAHTAKRVFMLDSIPHS